MAAMKVLPANLAVVSLAIVAAARNTIATDVTSIAIARTFSVSDAGLLPESFAIWNEYPPCQNGLEKKVDLFLVYSQSLADSTEAQASIEVVKDIFSETNGWNGCFSNVYGLGVDIEPSVDLYQMEEQDSNPLWVNGPNRQFERTVRALQEATSGPYDLFYLMEMDSVPVQSFWLETILDEVHDESSDFAILGSKYRGDKWDTFFDKLPWSLINHINGNAIYNLSHPVLQLVVEQLEAEAETVANTIPYDYRISQIVDEVQSGQAPSFSQGEEDGEEYHLPATFVSLMMAYNLGNLIRETLVIGNYASTNMVPSYFDQHEVVVHGASILVPWDNTKVGSIGLAISDWAPLESHEIILTLESSTHPFENAVVIAPMGIETPPLEPTVVPVDYMSRMNLPDTADLCTVKVETTWFALTNSYHHLREDIQPMTKYHKGTYKPVIFFHHPDYDSCYGFPSCARDIQVAQEIVPGFDSVYQDFDFVFHTESRDKYCDFLASNTAWGDFPSATSYAAYLEKMGLLDQLYVRSDRNVFGSRRMFLPLDWSSPPTPVRRHLNAENSTSDKTDNSYICSAQRTQDECLSLPDCEWRAAPHSCHAKGSKATVNRNVEEAPSRPPWVGIISTILIICGSIAIVSLLIVGGRRFREGRHHLLPTQRGDSLGPLAGELSGDNRSNPNGSQPRSGSLEEHSLETIDLDPIRIIAEHHFEETENGVEFLNNEY